jgi:hypothetical protein
MAYSKQTWADSPSTSSPLSAARLNHIEDGIEAAHNTADGIKNTVNAKGDLLVGTADNTVGRFPVPDGEVVIGDSATSTGLSSTALPDTSTFATKSGSIKQFADVSDSSPTNEQVLRYDSGTNSYVPVSLDTLFAEVDANGRIVSSAQPQYYVPMVVINEGDSVPATLPAGGVVLSRPAPASLIPTPIGNNVGNGGVTSVAVTLTDSAAIGDYVIAAVYTSGEDTSPTPGGMPQTVTFAFGGTGAGAATGGWTKARGSYRSGTVQADIYYAKLTTAASSGSTITATVVDNRTHMGLSLAKGINLAASAVEDDAETDNNWASSTTLTRTLGPTPNPTANANDLAIMVVAWNGGDSRAVAGNSGWTALGPTLTVTNSASLRNMAMFYKVLDTTGAVTGNFTFTATDVPPSTGAFSAALATFKAA